MEVLNNLSPASQSIGSSTHPDALLMGDKLNINPIERKDRTLGLVYTRVFERWPQRDIISVSCMEV